MIPTDICDLPTPLSAQESSKISIKELHQLDSQTHSLIREVNQDYIFFVESNNRFLWVQVEPEYVMQKAHPISIGLAARQSIVTDDALHLNNGHKLTELE